MPKIRYAVAMLALAASMAHAKPVTIESVRQALRDRSYANASELAAQRIRETPADEEARYLQALAFYHLENYADARKLASALATSHPTSRWLKKARFLEADCLTRSRQFQAAVALLHTEAAALLSPARKREVCGVILGFADALARERDPNNPADLEDPQPNYHKAYALYSKALQLEIDDAQREEVLFKRARAAEHVQLYTAINEYQAYLKAYDPTWGDAVGRERRPTGAHRWQARERLVRATIKARQSQALMWTEDLLRLLETEAGASAPKDLAATAGWLRLHASGLPRPYGNRLPGALRAIDDFLTKHPTHPATVVAAYWRAEALRHNGRHDEALAAYRSFAEGKGFVLPGGELAKLKLDVLKATPQELRDRWTREAVFNQGVIRGQQARLADAMVHYQDYVQRFPNGPHWSASHAAMREAKFQLCLQSVSKKRYDEARARFDRFLAAHPLERRAAQILFLLGQVRVAEGEAAAEPKTGPKNPALAKARFLEAIAAWKRLASKYPNTQEAFLGIYRTGLLLEERFGDMEGALSEYRKVRGGSAYGQARARIALLTKQHLEIRTERVFRTNEAPTVKVETRNLETLSIRQYFLDLEGYFVKHHETDGVERLDIALIQPDATWEVKVADYKKFAPRTMQVPVRFPGEKPGVCLIHVASGDYESTTLVVRSDLELIVRTSREELVAFAQDVRRGTAAAGVKVLVSDGKKVFLRGETGKDGVLRKTHERLNGADNLQVFAQHSSHVSATSLGLRGLSNATKLTARGYVTTDRPAYQPGQTVHVKAVLRSVKAGSYALPGAKTYFVTLLDSRGRTIGEENVALNKFGTLCAEFALDSSVPNGQYQVVTRPSDKGEGPRAVGTFRVEQFQLRPLELSLEAPSKVYRRGETVKLEAIAKHSWGQPAADEAILLRFPDGRTQRGRTDARGRFTATFDTSTQVPGAALMFHAELSEANVRATFTVYLPRLGYSVSVAPSQPLTLAGEPVEVTVESKGPDGKPVGRDLVLQVLRRIVPTPDPVLAKVPWFGRRAAPTATITVHEVKTTTDPKTGKALVNLTLEAGGDYVLRAVGQDRFKQSVSGEGRLKVSGEDDDVRLRIFSESATLKVGGSSKVRLHSRIKAPTLALVTWEGDAVIAHKVMRLPAGFSPVETAIDHVHFPNFRLAITALDGTKLRSAHKDFRVERELKVEVVPSKERYEPGATAPVELRVTDQRGQPVQAELSLSLVEETLYARFPEQVLAIRDAFEQGATRRAEFRAAGSNAFHYEAKTTKILDVFKQEAARVAELSNAKNELEKLDSVMAKESMAMRSRGGRRDRRPMAKRKKSRFRQSAGAPAPGKPMAPSDGLSFDEAEADDDRAIGGEGGGGSGGGEATPRQDRLGAGFWKCSIVTDAQGKATVRVPLPERTTRWRLTSRGVTPATLVGQSLAHVVTAKDFFAELRAPRQLREGDDVRLLARVHGPAKQDVKLVLELRDGDRLLAMRRASGTTGESGSVDVLLPKVKIPAVQSLRLILRASSGQAEDALERSVPVLAWGEQVIAHGGGSAKGDASVVLRLPANDLRSRWLTVRVGPTLEGSLADLAMNSGRGWPNSLGAQLLGLASALDYARRHDADTATRTRLEVALRRALSAVTPRQNRSGGWGQGSYQDLRETCFVVWALAEAAKVEAFQPSTQAAKRALQNAFRGTNDFALQARILHALAMSGDDVFRLANSLYRSRNRLDPVATAQLSLVFHKLERLGIARELARKLKAKPSGNPRLDAWKLLAISRANPGTRAAQALADSILQGRGTLPSCAIPSIDGLVVAAIARHLADSKPEADDARVRVTLNGTLLRTVTRKGVQGAVSFRVDQKDLPARGDLVLRFQLQGRAHYTYSATLRGFRPTYNPASRNGWRVRHRKYTHARLRHRGRPIGVDSSSPVKNVELGQRIDVRVYVDARAERTNGLVLVEPLPAGFALAPNSLSASHVHHEVRDGELRLYYRPGHYVGSIRYALVGRTPGDYRIPPTRVLDELDPSRSGQGAQAALTVLPPGVPSTDPYKLNDSERLALGRLHFAEGSFEAAIEMLTPLFERKRRPSERDLAKMLLWIHTDAKHYDARRVVQAFEILAVRYPDLEVPFDKILVVGRAYRDLGEHERALLVFRATIDASFLSDSEVGAVLADQGQNLGALDFQESLWWRYPNTAQVANSLFATSQRLYELAPQASRLSKEPRLALPGVPARAKAPTRVALLARTISMLRAFLANHPASPLADDAAFSLTNAFLDLRRHEDVVAASVRSQRVYPKSDFLGSFQYMTALGHFWKRDYATAQGHAETVAKGKTRFAHLGKYILGQIHHARGDAPKAIVWYETVKTQFPDAKESIDYFKRTHLKLPEVTVVRPGKPVTLELKSRNLEKARLEVYKVDLMKLYLREKDLSKITKVELAGIAPQLKLEVPLGTTTDYKNKTISAKLAGLKAEGAYLVIARSDGQFASGLVLITPLAIEVQEDESGRVRVNLANELTGVRPADVHVKAVGSRDGTFKSGETDLRGVFAADGLNGKVTVIARAGDARYAFYRGTRWLGAGSQSSPVRGRPRLERLKKVDYEGYLKQQNRALQQRYGNEWDQKRRRTRKGVQVQEAR